MKKIYLSGPMTGLPDLNYPAFNAAASALRAKGLDVINPAEIEIDGEESWVAYMRANIKTLCDCHVIALLPGWENSDGSHLLELYLARWFKMRIVFLEDLISEVYAGVPA